MTNIIAAVAIGFLTNVVVTDNAVYKPDYSMAYATLPVQWGQMLVTPATEQYRTTNVTQRTSITVTLEDGDHTFTIDKSISSVTAVLRKTETWNSAGTRTNSVMSQADLQSIYGIVLTNSGYWNWKFQNH